jgi:cytochrome c oxidase accessory protein FixG
LIVSYDQKRGEGENGRAKLGKENKTPEERSALGQGDCIDCGYCVQVCPTGIDIRNGLQIQCISCALCVDACDTIMDKMGWQRGLVGYSSQRVEEGGDKAHFLRPKVIGYFTILIAAMVLLVWSVTQQAPFDVGVSQVRQPLFVKLSDGRIQNSYEIKVNNKTGKTLTLSFSIDDLPGAELDMGKFQTVELRPEQRLRLMARINLAPQKFDGKSRHIEFIATPKNMALQPVEHESVFYIPGR